MCKNSVFWVIEDNLIEHIIDDNGMKSQKNIWDIIRPDNCNVDYDYYPRGLIMFDTVSDIEECKYFVSVFIDKCISDEKHKDMIIKYYNLDNSNIDFIKWIYNMKDLVGTEYYTCHNCR